MQYQWRWAFKKLDATTLLRAATVMWNGCNVSNHVDANTEGCQGTNRRFATGTRTFDLDIKILDALLYGSTTCHF